MFRQNKTNGYIIISNVILFILFTAIALFGVGDLDWDKAKRTVNKRFFSWFSEKHLLIY